jgi:hypothetical protein
MPMDESNVFHFSVLWCGGGIWFRAAVDVKLDLDGVALEVEVEVDDVVQPASNWFACRSLGRVVVGVLDVIEVPRRRGTRAASIGFFPGSKLGPWSFGPLSTSPWGQDNTTVYYTTCDKVVTRKKEMIKVKCKILKHAIHTCSPYYSGTHVHLHVGTRVCTT